MVKVTCSAPSRRRAGTYFTVSGTVFEDGGPLGLVSLGPIAGASVAIYRNGTQFGSDTTDGAGFYSDRVRINRAGGYQIRAKALGQWSNSVWITIWEEEPEHDTSITIYSPPAAYEGVAFNVWGRLYDSETGGFLSGKTITLRVDGVQVASTSTDFEGIYAFDVTIHELGDHLLRARFGGTSASLRVGIR